MNACDAVQELLSAHALEALGDTEETLVRDHLGDCGACQEAKQEATQFLSLIEAPPVKAPDLVWSKIRTRIDREHAADPVRDTAHLSPMISLGCSFCRGVLERGQAVYCASCLAPHHPECFEEHGRCSVMGCGERTVVRSQEPPRAIEVRPRRSRARRWLGGGLASLVMAGVGAAALVDDERVLRARGEVRPAARASRYRVQIEEATLGEVVQAMSNLPDTPRIDPLPPGYEGLLLRDLRLADVAWTPALEAVCEGLGLQLIENRTQRSVRIQGPKRFDADARDRAQGVNMKVDSTLRIPLRSDAEPQVVHRGWEQRVTIAPGGRAFAIREARRLRLVSRGSVVASQALNSELSDVEWSPDGSRLAYVAGRGQEGALGLFDVSTERAAHIVDDSFPGLDEGAQVTWSSVDGQLLLKTREDLKLVDTRLGGEAITLSTPSPIGLERFEILALDASRFMVLYSDGIEMWDSNQLSSRPLLPRVIFPVRYQVATPVARGRKVVVSSQAWAVVLDTRTGSVEKLEERNSAGSTFRVALDATGQQVATLQWDPGSDRDELYVRSLENGDLRCVRPMSDDVVRGFAWGPQGAAIAFWTDFGVYVDDFSGPSTEIHRFADQGVRDVAWLGSESLIVTARGLQARRGRVAVEEQR